MSNLAKQVLQNISTDHALNCLLRVLKGGAKKRPSLKDCVIHLAEVYRNDLLACTSLW